MVVTALLATALSVLVHIAIYKSRSGAGGEGQGSRRSVAADYEEVVDINRNEAYGRAN